MFLTLKVSKMCTLGTIFSRGLIHIMGHWQMVYVALIQVKLQHPFWQLSQPQTNFLYHRLLKTLLTVLK